MEIETKGSFLAKADQKARGKQQAQTTLRCGCRLSARASCFLEGGVREVWFLAAAQLVGHTSEPSDQNSARVIWAESTHVLRSLGRNPGSFADVQNLWGFYSGVRGVGGGI